jgi:hypothetical protein
MSEVLGALCNQWQPLELQPVLRYCASIARSHFAFAIILRADFPLDHIICGGTQFTHCGLAEPVSRMQGALACGYAGKCCGLATPAGVLFW